MARLWLFALLLLTTACNLAPVAEATLDPIPTPVLTTLAAPPDPPPPYPTAPATPAPPVGAWQFRDVATQSGTAVLISDGSGFALNPAWTLASGTYIHQEGAFGETQNPQRESLTADTLAAIAPSLTRLYPTQAVLTGHAQTDDYPTRSFELAGADGQQLLIFSDSTGNPGHGPWNVFYNGQLYAQYNGDFGDVWARHTTKGDTTAIEGETVTVSTFATQGQLFSATDTLIGQWSNPATMPRLTLPPDLQAALLNHPTAAALMRRHSYTYADYVARMDIRTEPPRLLALTGTVTFYGTTSVAGQPTRYTFSTPFKIEGGTVSYFGADEAALERILADSTALLLTRRVASASPDVVLALSYNQPTTQGILERPSFPILEKPLLEDTLNLPTCGLLSALSRPNAQEPYRTMTLIVGDSRLTVVLDPSASMVVRAALDLATFPLPVVAPLTVGNTQLSLGYVRTVRSDFSTNFRFGLNPATMTRADLRQYQQYADSLGAEPNYGPDDIEQYPEWYLPDSTLRLRDDGALEIYSCR